MELTDGIDVEDQSAKHLLRCSTGHGQSPPPSAAVSVHPAAAGGAHLCGVSDAEFTVPQASSAALSLPVKRFHISFRFLFGMSYLLT